MSNPTPPGKQISSKGRLEKVAQILIVVVILLVLLYLSRKFIIPIMLAIFVWGLLNALADFLGKLAIGSFVMPGWLSMMLSVVAFWLFIFGIYEVLAGQANSLVAAAPGYQENFTKILGRLTLWAGIGQLPSMEDFFPGLNLGAMLGIVGGSLGSIAGTLVLVAIYTGFLFTEQKVFSSKLNALQPCREKAERTRKLFIEIADQIKNYLWIKTLISLLTGLLSYIVLKWIGVDFASVWAMLITLLNYIPNIGSIIGVIFPAVLTLVQFDSLVPFLLVSVGLGVIQFVVGNVVEPAIMGKSLNLSSLMIVLSLTFWGMLWGIPGMFMSVPIMVAAVIVCSHIEGLRGIAVILSADGSLLASEQK